MASITINTDGACSGNPGPGGFAAIIETEGGEITIVGGEPRSTNNKMEMAAAIEALDYLEHNNIEGDIEVRSDSTYLTNAFNKRWLANWKKQNFVGRKNADLWRRLDALVQGRKIKWTWVRGHSGDAMNERCDALAVLQVGKARSSKQAYWCEVQT